MLTINTRRLTSCTGIHLFTSKHSGSLDATVTVIQTKLIWIPSMFGQEQAYVFCTSNSTLSYAVKEAAKHAVDYQREMQKYFPHPIRK